MRLRWFVKFRIGRYRFMSYCRPTQYVTGYDSDLPDGQHIVMIDTDSCSLRQVESECMRQQAKWGLGNAIIISTGRPDSWHVIYRTRRPWRQALAIAFDFEHCDLKHIKFSMDRGHFTLRLSPKSGRRLDFQSEIWAEPASDIYADDIFKAVRYETAAPS